MTMRSTHTLLVVLTLLGTGSGCVPGEHASWEHPPFCAHRDRSEHDAHAPRDERDHPRFFVPDCQELEDAGTIRPDAGALCTAPSWRFDLSYHPGDRVQSGGQLYVCAPGAASAGCSPCSLEPPATSALTKGAWTDLGTCPGASPLPAPDRAAVDGYFPSPSSFMLASGSAGSTSWRYTTSAPAEDWTQPRFDPAGWLTGESGFFAHEPFFPGDAPRTPWPVDAPELWLRTTFSVAECDIPEAMLWARWDDSMEVYINGVEALRELGWTSDYRYLGLTAAARAALHPGLNTIAVHVRDVGGAKYFDLGLTRFGALTDRPVSGFERTAALGAYTSTVREFMVEHGIPAGVLAVMKRDKVVVARGFGWADKAFTRQLAEDAVLRLASNDKLFTLDAVRTMLDAGTIDPITGQLLSDDTPVFPLLAAHGLAPIPGAAVDPQIEQVTVRQLLEHRGGLQELPTPAQLYADLQLAPGTTTAIDNVRWVYSQPLVFAPGSTSQYSSSGFMVLRYLIHAVKGDLLRYLREVVLAPVGTSDVFLAHERLANRSPREPWYATFVPPYDRWVYLEDYTALASSAEALTRLLRGYHLAWGTRLIDPLTGQWAAVPDNGGGIFFGAYEGTWSMALQRRWDEVNVAVIFNQVGAYDGLYERLVALTDSLPESAWGL